MSSRSMPQHRPCIPLFPTWQGSAASIKCGAPRETTSQALVSYVFGRGVVATPIAFQLRGAIAGVNSFLMTSLGLKSHAFLAELLNTAILSSQKESHSDVMNLSFAVQAPVSAHGGGSKCFLLEAWLVLRLLSVSSSLPARVFFLMTLDVKHSTTRNIAVLAWSADATWKNW